MLNTETIPIEIFVAQVMATKAVTQITDSWPLKSESIVEVVIKHFNDLGVYSVSPFGQYDVMRQELMYFLENSQHIIELIDKAKKAAAAAAQRGRMTQET
jgi:hypothetical protein